MGADNPLAGVLPEEFSSIEWTPALPTVASPSWVGGDSLFFEGRMPGGVPLLYFCLYWCFNRNTIRHIEIYWMRESQS